MELTTRTLPARKHIALVAHDHCKQMLMSWVERHQPLLEQHVLYATGTKKLNKHFGTSSFVYTRHHSCRGIRTFDAENSLYSNGRF